MPEPRELQHDRKAVSSQVSRKVADVIERMLESPPEQSATVKRFTSIRYDGADYGVDFTITLFKRP